MVACVQRFKMYPLHFYHKTEYVVEKWIKIHINLQHV